MSSAGGISELEQTIAALRAQYASALMVVSAFLVELGEARVEEEEDRDRLLRESARILSRDEAAGYTGLSRVRVSQIITEATA